ncbi:MAG: hypothetical protein ACI4XE_11695 [Acutalibacteraceae bacterium]
MKRKRIFSVILSLCLLMCLFVPAFTASAAIDYPIIYVEGFGGALYKDTSNPTDENRIYPTGADVGAIVSKALKPCLTELAAGTITGNYEKYADELYNALAPVYKDLVLDKNGEPTDNSGCGRAGSTTPGSRTYYNAYYFRYDWRISPVTLAADLKDYVEAVKSLTGKSKVNIVGRCLGANIVSAYMTKYESHAKENLNSVIMFMPSTMGINMLGAIFSGNIRINPDALDRFLDYYLNHDAKDLIEDETTRDLVTSLVTFLNQVRVLGVGVDMLQHVIDTVKDDVVSRLALASYGSFPSYWAMVDSETYEEARDYIFKGIEDEYAGMIEKTDDFHYNVQLKFYDTVKRLEESGVYTSVIAKYNIPMFPLYEECEENGDLFTGLTELSFGATSAKIEQELPKSYIESLADKRFVSPDNKVDASTCLIPERTWFIKNLAHAGVPSCVDELIGAIFEQNGHLTVFDNERLTQYLNYDETTDTMSPVTEPDKTQPANGTLAKLIKSVLSFFKNLLKMLAKLFQA